MRSRCFCDSVLDDLINKALVLGGTITFKLRTQEIVIQMWTHLFPIYGSSLYGSLREQRRINSTNVESYIQMNLHNLIPSPWSFVCFPFNLLTRFNNANFPVGNWITNCLMLSSRGSRYQEMIWYCWILV